MRSSHALILLALLVLNACGPAYDCDFHAVAKTSLDVMDQLLVVPVGINGQRVNMIVDTGAERTTISASAAQRLGLVTDPRFASQATGIGGSIASSDVKIDQFVLGGTRFPLTRIAYLPLDVSSPRGLQAEGLLGADVLLAFDLDIDIPGHTLTLYRRRVCPRPRPPWEDVAIEVPGVSVKRDRLAVPVTLDNAAGTATLDTGAQTSIVGHAMAQRLGLNDMRMTGDPVVHQHGVGPSVVAVPMHRFAQLRIGPVVIAHPQLAVMPEDANFGDMLIGEDFLRNRRVWLSFNPPLIFVTPLR